MPVFNGERFIEEAIASILGQTMPGFELIISDNASTDRTGEICRAWAGRDKRIRYERNESNLGAAENYNRVFRAASGRYFKWAAHDDICAPAFLERCVERLERDPTVVLCYPRSIFIDDAGRRLAEHGEQADYTDPRPHRRLRTWLMDRPGGWCNLVFGVIRSEALAKTRLIGKFAAADYILVAELGLLGKLVELEEPLFLRRDHPGRSGVAHAGVARTTLWYDTSAKRKRVYLPRWRLLAEYMRGVRRVPIGLREKLRSGAVVLRWAVRFRYQLKDDLVRAVRTIGRRHAPETRTSA